MKGFGRMHFASILKKGYASEKFVYGPRMAPEIERGSQHDFRADIWSLGQLAIQLMSEVTNATDFAVAGPDHVNLCRPWKAGVPDDVKQLCYDMIDTDPQARPSIEEIIANPFFH